MKFFTTFFLFAMATIALGNEQVGGAAPPKMSLANDRGGQGRFAKESDASQQRQRRRANEVEDRRRRLVSQHRGL